MAADSKTVLITGGNRGIGYCILTRLLKAFPHYKYLVGVRDAAAGQAALDSLRSEGILTPSHRAIVIPLDLASNQSIAAAVATIQKELDSPLDVLINNAAVGLLPDASWADLDVLQEAWAKTFRVNVFAPHIIFQNLLPLLLKSASPRVINISSGRGSLTRSSAQGLPPTQSVPYSVSKTALNALGLEMEKVIARDSDGRGRVWSAAPGHCKTAFNNYRGTRDPLDGAGVVEVLLRGDEDGSPVESGFWEEDNGKLISVPW